MESELVAHVDDGVKDEGMASDPELQQADAATAEEAVDAAEAAATAKRREDKRKQLEHLKQVSSVCPVLYTVRCAGNCCSYCLNYCRAGCCCSLRNGIVQNV